MLWGRIDPGPQVRDRFCWVSRPIVGFPDSKIREYNTTYIVQEDVARLYVAMFAIAQVKVRRRAEKWSEDLIEKSGPIARLLLFEIVQQASLDPFEHNKW